MPYLRSDSLTSSRGKMGTIIMVFSVLSASLFAITLILLATYWSIIWIRNYLYIIFIFCSNTLATSWYTSFDLLTKSLIPTWRIRAFLQMKWAKLATRATWCILPPERQHFSPWSICISLMIESPTIKKSGKFEPRIFCKISPALLFPWPFTVKLIWKHGN